MPSFPDTRASLILRLANCQDVQAWEEFVSLYEPVVYRLARQKGLQHADAEEVVQEVLSAVAHAVESWIPDPARGRFRDWLFLIARNLVVNFLTRRKHKAWGTGGSDAQRLLDLKADFDSTLTQSFDTEYQRELFCKAAERVQSDVNEKTWQAFWLAAVVELPAIEVAKNLKMSTGSVYIARCRVMARLNKEVRRLQGQDRV